MRYSGNGGSRPSGYATGRSHAFLSYVFGVVIVAGSVSLIAGLLS
jgi:hypothetical protein